MDALRGTALVLGIALHAGLPYLPGPGIGWAVHDRSTHWLFGAGILTVHSFRLEVFFLMAGFFARLLWIRRGARGFVLNRLVRVLVPFLAGWFVVFPWLAFAWIWGAMHGDPSAMHTALVQAIAATCVPLLSVIHLTFLKTGFPLTHLWFLYYLGLIYGLFLAGRTLLLQFATRNTASLSRADRLVRALVQTRWCVVIFGLFTWLILMGMKTWGVDTPDKTFVPHLPAVLLFGLMFSVGWLLHRQPALLEVLARRWRAHLVAGLLLAIPTLLLSSYESHKDLAHLREIRWLFLLSHALMMWSWVLALPGLFVRFCSGANRFWRYLSDSSYWLYIVHLPIVVILQVIVARQAWNCGLKFGLVCGASLLICLVTYHYLVRPTPIGLVLNGRRHPFRWWPGAGTWQNDRKS
jgi:glucan biosynthesis protein C